MRNIILPIIYITLIFYGPAAILEASEIELTGGINNMAFDSAETSQIPQFEGSQYIIGDLKLDNSINNVLGYNLHYSRDPVLQNNVTGKIWANTKNLNLEFGVFFGIDDKFKKMDLGISGGIELLFPGILFLSFNGSTSIDIKNEYFANNNRQTMEAKFGFWLPNLLPVFSADIKTYTREEENSLILRDELIRLMFSTEIFAKNFPVIFRIDAGYDILSHSRENGNSGSTELKYVFAGLEMKWQLIRQIRLIAGFEMPVYFIESEKNLADLIHLYKAYGGFALTFF
ncbi:MAG: hypothetical protein FWC03_10685 [Treponema sp.]|nr:hypothetical protein [Treponema sp.]